MIFIKKFKSQKKIREFLNNSNKNFFYKTELSTKWFFQRLEVTFFEINDIISFCKEHLGSIIKDILLTKDYEMSFSYSNKQFLITLNIRGFKININIFDFVFILETLLHTYISRKFQNDFKFIIIFNYDKLMLLEAVQSVVNRVLSSKKDQLLPVMNKEQRKLVHSNVLKFPEVISKSIGSENTRQIVLKYNYKK
ncbi:R3H domain-containing nucleic acid-binding protein [Spiroplasma endosymbiont of Ammophila pubescens]|uniref:R3H domain-containing nucleic acid-binding protein n=1 Tax=Spiroplasma endosymbiont of Ammophila pubescens TaxID=3066315 RepID=UPI0032B241DC